VSSYSLLSNKVCEKRLCLIVAALGEWRGGLKVHLLLGEGGALDEGVVEVSVLGRVSSVALIVPLDLKVGAVVVVVHTDLLVEHLIGPEPETAKILIISKSIALSLDGTEPVGDLGRDVERSAVGVLLLGLGVVAEHADLGKILLNRVLEADEEVTELRVRITDSVVKALELSGLEGDREKVLHELVVQASLGDIVLVILERTLTDATVRTSLLLNARDPVLRVKRTRADSPLVPGADVLHPISHGVRATATTTVGAGAVGQIVPAVTDDETTGLALLGGELIVVTNNVHGVATLADGLAVDEELTVHVEHGRKNASAGLRAIVAVSRALDSKTRRALHTTLPIRIIAREEVDSVVHLRRPGKRTVVQDHQALSLHDVVSSSHALDVKLDGVLGKSSFHARALVLVLRIRHVGADRGRKNLVVHILKVVQPPDFTTLSAVVEDKVTDDIANIRMVLASLDHSETISLLVKTDVLILLEVTLLDTVLTVALLKDTNGGKVPASATVLLVVTRSLVLGGIAVGEVTLAKGVSSTSLLETTGMSNALHTRATNTTGKSSRGAMMAKSNVIVHLLLGIGASATSNVRHRNARKQHASDNSCRNKNSLHH